MYCSARLVREIKKTTFQELEVKVAIGGRQPLASFQIGAQRNARGIGTAGSETGLAGLDVEIKLGGSNMQIPDMCHV